MRSLKYRLLLFILPLCLVPLIGISIFSYYIAKERITEDRIVLYLEQIAQDIADTVQLTLLEKKEETVSMALFGEFSDYLQGRTGTPPSVMLDKLILVHEVYDVIVLFDVEGRIVTTNSISRIVRSNVVEYLSPEILDVLNGQNLIDYTPNSEWLQQVRAGRFGYLGWHISPLVHRLYRYLDNDIAQHYSLGFSAPVYDERFVVVGGILALMNWEYIQEILDKVETDLEARSLNSGYAFMLDNDRDTTIAHKFRRNRQYARLAEEEFPLAMDNYGTRLVEDHRLTELQRALSEEALYARYEFPPGNLKISGLAYINHEFFHWVCGVGINDKDMFAPVHDLRAILVWTASLTVLLVVLLTYSVARKITVPLKNLTRGARVIAGGDFSQRVDVTSRDEIGELARTFNEMATSLEDRTRALLELTRSLEEKVKERTRELEESSREVEKAYHDLKEAQFQLVQSEKMASLGQLVAGIAHEIKNPLNFIYGNTDFLKNYVARLRQLVESYESASGLSEADRAKIESFKEEINYSFMLEDLDTLVQNFEDGAERIHSIIDDLRTFSRMESDDFKALDIHAPIDLALSLLQNEYRGRIQIVREYGTLPEVECHPGKLNQVFMNILANACQAISGEGTIRIRTALDNGYVRIDVSDTGEGIEPEHLEKIFEPFFTTKPVGQGTGLGLSISYAIIRQHSGTIEVESERGKGTLCRIRLPVKP